VAPPRVDGLLLSTIFLKPLHIREFFSLATCSLVVRDIRCLDSRSRKQFCSVVVCFILFCMRSSDCICIRLYLSSRKHLSHSPYTCAYVHVSGPGSSRSIQGRDISGAAWNSINSDLVRHLNGHSRTFPPRPLRGFNLFSLSVWKSSNSSG
jgi:hypothetical protein